MVALYVKAIFQVAYDVGTSTTVWQLLFSTPDSLVQPAAVQYYITQGTLNPFASPFPAFPTPEAAIAYFGPTAGASLQNSINTSLGFTYYNSINVQTIDSQVKARFDAIDVSTKSDKASFAVIANLAAHGVANTNGGAVTTNPTNYNTLSGLLGIASGLNDANAAQNDLATKYNDCSAKINSILTWLGTTKDKINAVKAAGAV